MVFVSFDFFDFVSCFVLLCSLIAALEADAASYFWVHHTRADTLDKVSEPDFALRESHGVTSKRACAPGLASEIINTIRDGRAARAEAAESREEAVARRGTRHRAPRKRFTPPK